ncbi:uncharacterized protein LOC134257852 [Saccostrea cucullata]|uniref:uncharacterized protein LOC134257852 n=1 Tax=Saccostrea cuccullata TaxID=36930 RepID=UPI002ED55B06
MLACYRVVASESFTLPPRSEVIASCDVCVPEGKNRPCGYGIVEPRNCLIDSNKGLVGRTLVSNHNKVPIRVLNLSTDAQTIYKGTNMGQLSPVVKILEGENKDRSLKGPFSKELQALSEKSKTCLNQKQKTEVDKLLSRYAFLFAGSDDGLGRTNVVKHCIDTGDALTIKQPPRRLPVHMREEADRLVDDMLERNVIEPSSSPWASGIVLVKKKLWIDSILYRL